MTPVPFESLGAVGSSNAKSVLRILGPQLPYWNTPEPTTAPYRIIIYSSQYKSMLQCRKRQLRN